MSAPEPERIAPIPSSRRARPLIVDVGIDANDVETMAAFYEHLMGYVRSFERPGHVYLTDPSGLGPHLYIQQVPEPRTAKNRLHLDVVVADLAAAVAHAEALGGRALVERKAIYSRFVVCADPEGNEFCLVDRQAWDADRPPWWQH